MNPQTIKKENNKVSFGCWEAVSLIIVLICNKIFLNFPRRVAEEAGTAGWLMTIYVSLVAIFLFFLISVLFKKFEGKDILDISEFVAGKAGRVIIGIVFLIILIFTVSIVLRQFAENIKIISLPLTPLSIVTFLFVIGIITGASLGLEPIMRISVLIVPIIIIGFLVILISSSNYFEISNITPIFGLGLDKIFLSGLNSLSIFSDFVILLFLPPFLKTHNNFKKTGYYSFILSSIFLVLASLSYLLIYQYPNSNENFLPIYQITRIISHGRFFQRVESVFLVLWVLSALLYLTMVFFFILHIFRKTFNLDYYKPLIPSFIIIVFSLSMIPSNLTTAIEIESNYIRRWSWLISFAGVIIVALIAVIKKKFIKGRFSR